MPETLLGAFTNFPDESNLVGRILAGYATLEVDLLHCANALRQDFDATLKVLFRNRGETQRINSADALCRQLYRNLGLSAQFEQAIGDLRYCLRIRNQYAHCAWYDNRSGHLVFLNIEELADSNDSIPDFSNLNGYQVDVPLLERQIAFMETTSKRLIWANQQARLLAGELSSHAYTWPKENQRPPLRILQ